jgi:hypothetical protein
MGVGGARYKRVGHGSGRWIPEGKASVSARRQRSRRCSLNTRGGSGLLVPQVGKGKA